jgi:glycogen operon protein
MGDEVGRSQHGNNNGYCQDNEIAWLEWKDIGDRDRAFLAFVRGVIRLRNRYPILRARNFLHGDPIDDSGGLRNVIWLRPDGQEMDEASWTDPNAKVVGLVLSDATHRLLLLVNSYHEPIAFRLPGENLAKRWQVRVDAGRGEIDPPNRGFEAGGSLDLEGRSLMLLAGEMP